VTLRLSRFLARAGVSSRRGAADLVAAGRVRINGEPPLGPGDPVDPDCDKVTLDGKLLALEAAIWLVLHKPPGYVTSRVADERHAAVFTLLKNPPGALVAVGRLDVLSEGLLLFTTDGDLAARLMHPKWAVPRTYRVMITGEPDAAARRALDRGVRLEGEDRPVTPRRWSYDRGVLMLELAEGRSRVVRRVCAELGLGIRKLVRESYGPISIAGLEPAQSRALTHAELDALYRAVELQPPRNG
jgi:23S rRNA pseudouridine2605 synthase